jgi:hypothetical protein
MIHARTLRLYQVITRVRKHSRGEQSKVAQMSAAIDDEVGIKSSYPQVGERGVDSLEPVDSLISDNPVGGATDHGLSYTF